MIPKVLGKASTFRNQYFRLMLTAISLPKYGLLVTFVKCVVHNGESRNPVLGKLKDNGKTGFIKCNLLNSKTH